MFFDRLKQEEKRKRRRLYDNVNIFGIQPLVTRFFPGKISYVQTYHNVSQPTLWIPFGKYLGIEGNTNAEYIEMHYAKATLAAALITIPSQLFYDIFWATVYCLIAAPSLIIGIVAAIHAAAYNECIQKYESQEIAQTALGNIICAPYFVLAIAVDLCREVIALGTRTYASKIESPEGRAQNYWVADNKQFKTNF